MEFGLKENIVQRIKNVIASFREIEEVIVYGSRAKGNYKAGSDIDLVMKGKKLNHAELNKISLRLDDLLLPYTFDISIWHHIENVDLIEHINRVGKVLYSKSQSDSISTAA